MLFQAALAAARPNSSPKAPSMAFQACLMQRRGFSKPSFLRPLAIESTTAVVVILHAENRLGDSGALEFLPSRIPSSTRVHASGLSCALRLGVALLRLTPPYGLRFPSSTDPP